ncbi:hypothetical protein NDU88_005612, partial [Pleurodeles waltl]
VHHMQQQCKRPSHRCTTNSSSASLPLTGNRCITSIPLTGKSCITNCSSPSFPLTDN